MSSSFEHAPTGELNLHKPQYPLFAVDSVDPTSQALSEVDLFQKPDFPQEGFYTDWKVEPEEVVALSEAFSDIRARHAVHGSEFAKRIKKPDMDEVREWDESNKYEDTGLINTNLPPFSMSHFLRWPGVRLQGCFARIDEYLADRKIQKSEAQVEESSDIPEHLQPEWARVFTLAEIEDEILDDDYVDGLIELDQRVPYFDNDDYPLLTYEPKGPDSTDVLPIVPGDIVLGALGSAFNKINVLDRRLGELDSIHAEIIADKEAELQQRREEFLFAIKNPDVDSLDLT